MKSKTVFYVCSFSTNIFLLVFVLGFIFDFLSGPPAAPRHPLWPRRVKVKFMASQRDKKKKTKSSQAFFFAPSCATIADKTNTFVASKRNVHKERFGRNVKIFVKMPTLYKAQSQHSPTSSTSRSRGQVGREVCVEAVIYLLVSATATTATANEYGWLNDAGNS